MVTVGSKETKRMINSNMCFRVVLERRNQHLRKLIPMIRVHVEVGKNTRNVVEDNEIRYNMDAC